MVYVQDQICRLRDTMKVNMHKTKMGGGRLGKSLLLKLARQHTNTDERGGGDLAKTKVLMQGKLIAVSYTLRTY